VGGIGIGTGIGRMVAGGTGMVGEESGGEEASVGIADGEVISIINTNRNYMPKTPESRSVISLAFAQTEVISHYCSAFPSL